jgi:hypothetical protein
VASAFSEEALNLLLDTAKAADGDTSKIRVLPVPHLNKVLFIDGFQKRANLLEIEPPQCQHELLSINDVIRWAQDHITDRPIVWVGHDQIKITLDSIDGRTRKDFAVYNLRKTPEAVLLFELANENKGFDQPQIVKLLRTKLWNCFANTYERDKLIASLRNVVASQASNLQHGRGTYEASLSTADDSRGIDWPDRLDFTIRLFADRDLGGFVNVSAAFDVDPKAMRFSIWTDESSLLDAINDTIAQAHNYLVVALPQELDEGATLIIPVYRGQP